jgi:hypothetical protein
MRPETTDYVHTESVVRQVLYERAWDPIKLYKYTENTPTE